MYIVGWSADKVHYNGAVWYVSDEGMCPGRSSATFKWDFFTARPVAAIFEEDEADGFSSRFRGHIESDVEIFASNTQPGA